MWRSERRPRPGATRSSLAGAWEARDVRPCCVERDRLAAPTHSRLSGSRSTLDQTRQMPAARSLTSSHDRQVPAAKNDDRRSFRSGPDDNYPISLHEFAPWCLATRRAPDRVVRTRQWTTFELSRLAVPRLLGHGPVPTPHSDVVLVLIGLGRHRPSSQSRSVEHQEYHERCGYEGCSAVDG